MRDGTEEGQRVTKAGGSKWIAVYRRIAAEPITQHILSLTQTEAQQQQEGEQKEQEQEQEEQDDQ